MSHIVRVGLPRVRREGDVVVVRHRVDDVIEPAVRHRDRRGEAGARGGGDGADGRGRDDIGERFRSDDDAHWYPEGPEARVARDHPARRLSAGIPSSR